MRALEAMPLPSVLHYSHYSNHSHYSHYSHHSHYPHSHYSHYHYPHYSHYSLIPGASSKKGGVPVGTSPLS